MRVLHINTADTGGAGKAVIRLMNGLLKANIDNNLLVLYKYQTRPHVHKYSFNTQSFFKQLQFSLKYRLHQHHQKKALRGKSHNYEVFSFPDSVYNILNHPLYKQADIIHLHWVAGFIDYTSFFKHCQKPIVWTLHDLNPFSGGFHYEGDYHHNEMEYKLLDTKIKNTKYKALKPIQKLQVVSPSSWMLDIAQNRSFFDRFQHIHIPNGIDLNVYQPMDKQLVRKKLGIPSDKNVLIFLAENITNKRKGFELLSKALKCVDPSTSLAVLVGNHHDTSLDFPHLKFDYVQEEHKLAEIYACADACIVPSLEDNLPNTMLEAMACGVPVVAFDIGGIPDMVVPYKTGLLASEKNYQMLGEKSMRYYTTPCYVVSWRKMPEKKH
ncbi:glycosyltransferase [Microscilla marina]|uniref:Glycosyl transferase, group 1/2 family protein, putative n=1 Tax=Microscilla marina ATCC 23134 TaxID=313606 RepID=A1ZCK9_MICM2|nr:glycosyltransferase [Microscilla marina]EAY32011.1 glycosyl transferase, group 1/2 family protein, putative [Microscilla marina ATCC 23134]